MTSLLRALFFERRLPWRYRAAFERIPLFFYDLGVFSGKVFDGDRKIHVVYFTCNKHIDYLFVSLRSLFSLGFEDLGSVYVYCDKDDFFSRENFSKLVDMGVKVKKTKHAMSWAGSRLVINELSAFKEIPMGSSDYVVKIDSDIPFLNSLMFEKIFSCDCDAGGTPHVKKEVNFKHFYGGGYFLSKKAVDRITSVKIRRLIGFLISKGFFMDRLLVNEDVFISYLVKRCGLEMKFFDFLDVRKDNHMPSKKELDGYSLIHFPDKDKVFEFEKKVLLK